MLYYNEDECPAVGIFWYNEQTNDLFGVYKKPLSQAMIDKACMSGLPFIHYASLHHQVWQKQHMHALVHHEPTKFEGDFRQVPRGRVSWVIDTFVVLVGNWARDKEDELRPLLRTYFGLQQFVFHYDNHFDIGKGAIDLE